MNIVLNNRELCDLELLLNGAYNPLTGYMTEAEYKAVCETMHLSDGNFFPLPINLCVDSDAVQHRELCLMDNTNYPLAKLVIDDKYQTDIDFEYWDAQIKHFIIVTKEKLRNT